jgi:hypothetical protein
MDLTLGRANNSPVLVADPAHREIVALANRLDAPDYGCSLALSSDGGNNWSPAQPVPDLPGGAEKCYAPEVAFDRLGTLYFLFVGLAGNGNSPMGVFLTRSTDRGKSFSAPNQVLGGRNFAVRMAIDPTMGSIGRLHLVWLHAGSDPGVGAFGPPPNPILSAYSDDGGSTFSSSVEVSDPSRERVVAPVLALGPRHAVHVGYFDLGRDAIDYQGLEGPTWDEPWSLVVASSSDGGQHFNPGVLVDDAIAAPGRVMLIFTMAAPALAVDGNGRLCAAWTDARSGDPDVLLRCSPGGRAHWSAPHRLNDDPVDNGHTQYLPRLAFSPNGRLDAIFYDRRSDPRNVLNRVYYVYSTDGGRHFSPNRTLTSAPFESRVGQQYVGPAAIGQVEFGGRLGLLSRPDNFVAAWTDTRNSQPPTTEQDIFSAVVNFGKSQRATWTAVVTVTLFLIAGLCGGLMFVRRRRGDGVVES